MVSSLLQMDQNIRGHSLKENQTAMAKYSIMMAVVMKELGQKGMLMDKEF